MTPGLLLAGWGCMHAARQQAETAAKTASPPLTPHLPMLPVAAGLMTAACWHVEKAAAGTSFVAGESDWALVQWVAAGCPGSSSSNTAAVWPAACLCVL